MNNKQEKLYTANDMKIQSLEQTIININDTLKRFEGRFDKIDESISELRKGNIDRMKESALSFRWIMGTILGLFGSMIMAIIVKYLGLFHL